MKGDYLAYKTRTYMNAWNTLQIDNPEIAKKIGYWNFRKLLSDMSDKIIESVLEKEAFELPEKLGTLIILGIPVDKKPIGLKYGNISLVRTENVVYSLRWLRNQKHSNIPNFYYFNFKTSILVRKIITQYIREDKFLKWLILSSFKQIKHIKKDNLAEDTHLKAKQKYNI